MTISRLLVVVCFLAPLAAQQGVDRRNLYERLLCVVPMVGSGTAEDPRRPAYGTVALSSGHTAVA